MNCELQEQRLGLVCASVYSSTTAIRNEIQNKIVLDRFRS